MYLSNRFEYIQFVFLENNSSFHCQVVDHLRVLMNLIVWISKFWVLLPIKFRLFFKHLVYG